MSKLNVFLLCAFLALSAGNLFAQTTHTWIGGSGNWSDTNHWDTGVVPSAADNVIFNDGSYTVTINSDVEINDVEFSANSGKQTLKIEGVTLTLTGDMAINDLGILKLTSGSEINGIGNITNNGFISAIVSTFNVDLANSDTLQLHGMSPFNNSLTTTENSFIHLYTNGSYITELALASDFTNNGFIKFDTYYYGYRSKLSLSSGTFTNSTTGEVLSAAGGGYYATHEISAPFQNDGMLSLEQPLKLSRTDASHINNGTINLQDGNLSIYLTDETTSFTNSGTITLAESRKLYINNGVFTQSAALNIGTDAVLQFYDTDVQFNDAFVNNSLIDMDLGSLEIAGDFTNNNRLELYNMTFKGMGALTNLGNISSVISTFEVPVSNEDTLELHGMSPFNNSLTTTENSFIHLYTNGSYITELTLASDFTNNGFIKFDTYYNNYRSKLSLSSGTFTNSATGEVLFTAGPGYYATHEISAPVQNNGQFNLDQSAKITNDNGNHSNNGIVYLDNATFTVSGQSFENTTDGEIGGNGTLDVSTISFANNGAFTAGSAPGIFNIHNDLPMAVTSVLGFELAGPEQGNFYNSFAIMNLAKLSGTLTIELVDGYVPNTNQEFILATYTSYENNFLVKNGLDIDDWKEFELLVEYNQIKLVTKNKTGIVSPYAYDDFATVLDGDEIEIDVMHNDTDPNAEDLAIISVGPATNGTTSISGNVVLYNANEGSDGEDKFIYTIQNTSGSRTSGLVTVTTNPQAPQTPVLASPVDSAGQIPLNTTLRWYSIANVDSFELELSTTFLFNSGNELYYYGLVDTFINVDLPEENTYYWRVRSQNAAGYSQWTDSWQFTTDDNVGVKDQMSVFPNVFCLNQNYPNPFNPTTTIHYDLPAATRVTLNVYDILGREIVTLVNQRLPAGKHQVIFDAANFPSGLYLYRLETAKYTKVRRMLLVK